MNPQQQSEPVQVTASKIESDMPPCDLRFFSEANAFAEAALKQIPELQAVAIIPLWAPPLDNVPPGILRLRDENQPYLAGLLQMLGKITAFSFEIHRDLINQLKALDRMAATVIGELQTKSAELQSVKQQLETQQTAENK
jgi:hypothetical protein